MQELKINKEFQSLIPPLSADEYAGLEKDLLNNGFDTKLGLIIIWNGILIDGHNRYEICRKHNISFKTAEKEFTDETDVKIWIIKNQFNRRNLTPFSRSELALELEPLIQEQAKRNQSIGHFNAPQYQEYSPVCQNSDKLDLDNDDDNGDYFNYTNTDKSALSPKKEKSKPIKPIDTKKELAKIAGVSHDTIAKVKKIKKEATDDVKEKLRSGEISVDKAYKDIKKKENQTKIAERKTEFAEKLASAVADNPPVITISDYNDYLLTISDSSVDLLFTDPPYSTDVDDIEAFAEKWLPQALAKVKDTGRAFICIGAYPKEIHAYFNVLLNQNKFIVDNSLIWVYKNTLGVTPKMKYNLNYQVIIHLYSKNSRALNTDVTGEMFSVQEFNAPDGRLGDRFHTWQKPLELAQRLINHTTVKGETVLDIFACTGTFLIAAAKMGRTAIGCEINPEHAEIAKSMGCKIVY